jgi:hypothetical protein
MELLEALVQAIRQGPADLGCNGDDLSMKLTDMLDRIVRRYERAVREGS